MSTLRVEFTQEARRDLLHTQDWYEESAPGLGLDFVRAVDAAVARILRFPEIAQVVHGQVRKQVLRRFPYSLFYVAEPGRIVVLGCFHQGRDPKAWPR